MWKIFKIEAARSENNGIFATRTTKEMKSFCVQLNYCLIKSF